MEKRNTLDQKFINLRQVFHDFQTSVRFSTSNSPADVFANQLKSYEFLGELEEHFFAEKVQYLYEFVHSIFSLIFNMIRESPNQRCEKVEDRRNVKTTDAGAQTEESRCEDQKKTATEHSAVPLTRHKKRAGLEIQIFEKDLTEMSFRERRQALQKMRDMINSEEEPPEQPNSFWKDFRPNIEKISYSKSDQSIKAAIDTFKESDISTHIFLKHFINEFVEVQDVKSSSQLLNKELIQSMSRAIAKYRGRRQQGRGRLRLFGHTVEEVVYPAMEQQVEYRISVSPMAMGNETGKEDEKEEAQQRPQAQLAKEVSNSVITQHKPNDFRPTSQLKRSRFPSLMHKQGEALLPITESRSHLSAGSSMSSISSKSGNKNLIRKKLKSQGQLNGELGSQRQSVRVDNNAHKENSDLLQKEKQKLKEKQLSNSKKLKKRNISGFMQKIESRGHRKSQQIRIS